MDQETIHPQNFSERVVWHAITKTYIYYLFGALYIMAPVVGWILFFHLMTTLYIQNDKSPDKIYIPNAAIIWGIAMIAMEVALLVAHAKWNLGTGKTIKSTIGWAKGWALLAVFPIIGALPIRPKLIFRAVAIVGMHTLIIAPLLIVAPKIGLPSTLFVSPLKAIGGPGPEFFSVSLYGQGPDGGLRWRIFTPWGPALGMVGVFYFIMSLHEKGKWKFYGLAGSIFMILASKSRLASIIFLVIPVLSFFISQVHRAYVHFLLSFTVFSIGLLYQQIIDLIDFAIDKFVSARADSSRVRAALGRIAHDRWAAEAPIYGHGIVEKGPHLVEYMMIGSHHTWYGLLYVKGIIGFIALLVPIVTTFAIMVYRSQHNSLNRTGLSITIVILLYTFSENLEVLAYLYWPALLVLGIAFKKNKDQLYDQNDKKPKEHEEHKESQQSSI